jgi:hypothetical protein
MISAKSALAQHPPVGTTKKLGSAMVLTHGEGNVAGHLEV